MNPLQFDTVRAKDQVKSKAAMTEWVGDHPAVSLEEVTVHEDPTGYTVYSVWYREADE